MDAEKVVITEFLECWKECRCLWDTEDDNYANKERRNDCYYLLLEIYKKWAPDASIGVIKRKMENMRAAYKREVRKVQASETIGFGTDQVHTPKLWYFDLLKFLDEKTSFTRAETLEEDSAQGTEEIVTVELHEKEFSNPNFAQNRQQRKRLRTSLEKKQESLLNTAHALLASKDDKWEIIGKSIGLQLKELSPYQQDIAQKLMAEVIFYGKRGRLTDYSAINFNTHYSNHFPLHCSSPPPSNNHPHSSTPSHPTASSMIVPAHGTAPQESSKPVI